MTRIIKFRALTWIEPQWVYGYFFKDEYGQFQIQSLDHIRDIFLIQEKTLSQFTGLHDKNGKEIFVGDILRANYFDVVDSKPAIAPINMGDVYWDDETMTYYVRANGILLWQLRNIEIIGNIYENPDEHPYNLP